MRRNLTKFNSIKRINSTLLLSQRLVFSITRKYNHFSWLGLFTPSTPGQAIEGIYVSRYSTSSYSSQSSAPLSNSTQNPQDCPAPSQNSPDPYYHARSQGYPDPPPNFLSLSTISSTPFPKLSLSTISSTTLPPQ
jgi:hypothetical protein